MSENPEIVEARKQLEILKQREKELEERLNSAELNTNTTMQNKHNIIKSKQKEKILQSQQNIFGNNFEDFFYRETSSHNYNESANSIYVKDTSKKSTMQQTNEQEQDTDEESDEEKPRRRPRVSNTQNTGVLINLSDDEDREIMQVFQNDEGNRHEADLFNSFQHFDGMISDINEEPENEGIREITDENVDESEQQYSVPNTTKEVTLLSDSASTSNNQYVFQRENTESSEEDEDTMQNLETRQRLSIQKDIAESLKREHDLQFQRGSFEKLNQNSDSDSEYENYPVNNSVDTRDKIMREIEEAKLRDIELHTKYKQAGIEQFNRDYDEESIMEEEQGSQSSRDTIALEIDELKKREEELRMNHNGYSENYSENKSDNEEIEKNEEHQFVDPRERIVYEMRVQQEKEVEINRLHRSLSNDNLLITYDSDQDESQYNKVDDLDTRGKMLREMEDLKLREREIRGSNSQVIDNEYDIIGTDEKAGENEESIDMRGRIYKEITELQQREEELKKHYLYKFNETQSFENISLEQDEPVDNDFYRARSLKDTEIKKFGSREDLAAFFGSSNDEEDNTEKKKKKTTKHKPKQIKIPDAFTTSKSKIFTQERNAQQSGQSSRAKIGQQQTTFTISSGKAQEDITNIEEFENTERAYDKQPNHDEEKADFVYYQQDNNDEEIEVNNISKVDDFTEPYFHDEMKPMKQSKKKLVLRRKSLQNNIPTKGLVSWDVKKEERKISKGERIHHQINTKDRKLHIHPIAAKWEKKGEEERQRKLAIENELQKRKEDRLRQLEEKAEYERHIRLLEQEEQNKREKKEEELKRLKIRQQSLNKLWTSKKSLVSDDDNSDRNDQHLSPKRKSKQHTTFKQNMKEAESLGGSLAIMMKIKKWEKKIAKNTNA